MSEHQMSGISGLRSDIDISRSGVLNYSVPIFSFEKTFDMTEKAQWMRENWTRSIVYAVCYVLFIFLGQQWMKHRPSFDLRLPLTIWNSVLAIFSILGVFRTYPAFFFSLYTEGFTKSICDEYVFSLGVTGFWSFLFALSKVLELGDTVFIVLRKQQLIFLHWYHHITVLIYTWYSFPDLTAPGRWFIVMNYSVHSLMYTYYAFRCMRFRIPRFIPMTITFMQLAQMIVGTYINVVIYFIKQRGEPCNQSYENLLFSLLMYGSYFFLFSHFFYKSYYGSGKFAKAVQKRAKEELTENPPKATERKKTE